MAKKLIFKTVNKVIAKYGYEVVQGEGYLYFWPFEGSTAPLLYDDSHPVCKLNHTNMESIIFDLEYKIKESSLNSDYFETKYNEFKNAKKES